MKPFIVLQSDFSNSWSAVSSMKGMIKKVDPTMEIYDGTHEIDPYNIWTAAQELRDLIIAWPAGTIFVSVVDPGVGSARRAAAARLSNGSLIITPDNGTLSLVKERITEIREIDASRNRYRENEQTAVFDGRDLFAFTAARLAAAKISFEETGRKYNPDDIVLCAECSVVPVIRTGFISTFVTYVLPWYGCVRAAVSNKHFTHDAAFKKGDRIQVQIRHDQTIYFDQLIPFADSFACVDRGKPLIYEGSSLLISLDLNQDNFARKYNIHAGRDWKIQFTSAK